MLRGFMYFENIKILEVDVMLLHPKMRYVYCGLDSHKDTHYAVFLTCFYEKLGEIEFRNVPSEFESFLSKANKFKSKDISIMFGMEDTSAYGRSLAVFLTSKGYTVKHVNASLVAHERKSLNVLQKTDSFDGECAARVLLNRMDSLPDFTPNDKYWTLSQLVTRRSHIVKANLALKNHLQSYIMVHYPSYKSFFCDVETISSLAFLEKYPSPSKLEGVEVEELVELLKANGNTKYKEKKALLILDSVKKDGNTKTAFQHLRDEMVVSIVKQVKAHLEQIKSMDKTIKEFLKEFDYKLETIRGVNSITAAMLISEIGDIERFPTASKLAKYAGISPVSYSSGKTNLQYANERGNRRLNGILFHLAVNVCGTSGRHQSVVNPIFHDYYKKKISEGKTTKQALKCVQRRLVNILWRMMKDKTEYRNPEPKKL
jgi:transposase